MNDWDIYGDHWYHHRTLPIALVRTGPEWTAYLKGSLEIYARCPASTSDEEAMAWAVATYKLLK